MEQPPYWPNIGYARNISHGKDNGKGHGTSQDWQVGKESGHPLSR
jgi:hypothetical protein